MNLAVEPFKMVLRTSRPSLEGANFEQKPKSFILIYWLLRLFFQRKVVLLLPPYGHSCWGEKKRFHVAEI